MSDSVRFGGAISKIVSSPDGSIRVEGIASSESIDRDGETILASAVEAALPDFMKHGSGALREMHRPVAAGRVDEVTIEKGTTRIIATVVDQAAVKKVQSKVYKGFSVGGRVLERDSKDRKVITKLSLAEISQVDQPANPDATLTIWKSAGVDARDEAVRRALDAMSEEDRAMTLIKAGRHFPRAIGR